MVASRKGTGGGWRCLKDKDNPCACQCHAMRRATRVTRSKRRGAGVLWSRPEDRTVMRLASEGLRPHEIAAEMNRLFRTDRTDKGVRLRINKLGGSTRPSSAFTRKDVEDLLGFGERKARRLMREGKLTARKPTNVFGETMLWHVITEEELAAFVDAWAGIEFDPSRMQAGPWKSRAELAARANAIRMGRAS